MRDLISFRNALKPLLSKLLTTYITNSSISVHTFLRISQGKGLASQTIRFALDENGGLILRPCDSSDEDQQWILNMNKRFSWSRETTAIISLWPKNQISSLFVELLDLFFRTHYKELMFEQFSELEKERIATVLLGIIDTNNSDLFGDDLLQGLQSMERIIEIALDPENKLDDSSEVLSICYDLLTFIASSTMKLPLVVEVEKKDKKDEEEVLYRRELEAVVTRMLHIVSKQTTLQVVSSIQAQLQTILSRLQTESLQHSNDSTNKDSPAESPSTVLRQVVNDLSSPYQPIRSFALSRLQRLIETTDKERLEKEIPEVISILKKGLNDDDSYVYLAAVNAMVILASIDHQRILPILLELFSSVMAPLDLRLRVGEAIVCTVHYMKDASVKYDCLCFVHKICTGTHECIFGLHGSCKRADMEEGGDEEAR